MPVRPGSGISLIKDVAYQVLAFEEARDRSVARMLDLTASHVPVPWAMDFARQAGTELVFKGGSPWPYGIEANRTTIDAFLQYAFEHGTCHRLLRAEEIFAEEALPGADEGLTRAAAAAG